MRVSSSWFLLLPPYRPLVPLEVDPLCGMIVLHPFLFLLYCCPARLFWFSSHLPLTFVFWLLYLSSLGLSDPHYYWRHVFPGGEMSGGVLVGRDAFLFAPLPVCAPFGLYLGLYIPHCSFAGAVKRGFWFVLAVYFLGVIFLVVSLPRFSFFFPFPLSLTVGASLPVSSISIFRLRFDFCLCFPCSATVLALILLLPRLLLLLHFFLWGDLLFLLLFLPSFLCFFFLFGWVGSSWALCFSGGVRFCLLLFSFLLHSFLFFSFLFLLGSPTFLSVWGVNYSFFLFTS